MRTIDGVNTVTGAVEVSRDADKIVTAIKVRVECCRCGDWSSGSYDAAVSSYREHLGYCPR